MKIRCPKSDGHTYFVTHVMAKQLVRLDNFGRIFQVDPSNVEIVTRPGETSPIVCAHCLTTAVVEKEPGE